METAIEKKGHIPQQKGANTPKKLPKSIRVTADEIRALKKAKKDLIYTNALADQIGIARQTLSYVFKRKVTSPGNKQKIEEYLAKQTDQATQQ